MSSRYAEKVASEVKQDSHRDTRNNAVTVAWRELLPEARLRYPNISSEYTLALKELDGNDYFKVKGWMYIRAKQLLKSEGGQALKDYNFHNATDDRLRTLENMQNYNYPKPAFSPRMGSQEKITASEFARRVRSRTLSTNPSTEDYERYEAVINSKKLTAHAREAQAVSEIDEVKRKIAIAEAWMESDKYKQASDKVRALAEEKFTALLFRLDELTNVGVI